MNDEERWYKLVLMHQESLCEFKRKFEFNVEDKKCQYKYRRGFVGREIQRI